MLVLSRKVGEAIYLGEDIIIHITQVQGNRVRVGIEAPARLAVHRSEIHHQLKRTSGNGEVLPGSLKCTIGDCNLPAVTSGLISGRNAYACVQHKDDLE